MMQVDKIEYRKAFREVLVILDNMSKKDKNKIPKDILIILEKFQDTNYKYELDLNKNLNCQNISKEAKAILANFYRDYWATDIKKQEIIEKEKNQIVQLENEKRKKYNPDDIFKSDEKINNKIKETNLVVVDEKNIFIKLLEKLKKFFMIK